MGNSKKKIMKKCKKKLNATLERHMVGPYVFSYEFSHYIYIYIYIYWYWLIDLNLSE